MSKKKFDLKKWCVKNIFPVATILSVVMVITLGLLIWGQIERFEDGMLDVCATQQDAYVQLVLDQINIKSNRDNEEIVKEILSSLDASSNKYWTFSKNEAMVFVKDVLETNKYQGFTTATYYVSDSARHFLEEIKLNKVTHKEIQIGEKMYIASGVVFEYGGDEYRLCLLTNRKVFLDNNKFLGAKINLCVLFAIVAFIFVVTAMEMARKISVMTNNITQQGETIGYLNESVNQLNDKLSRKELYDTRHNIMGMHMLPEFLEKLQKRDLDSITFARIRCASDEVKEMFFTKAQIFLDNSVLRFREDEERFLLIFLKTEQARIREVLQSLEMEGVEFLALKVYDGSVDLKQFYEEL